MIKPVLDKIEDMALIEDYVVTVSKNLDNGEPLPAHVPQLNNILLMESLSNISAHIDKLRKKLL